MNSMIKGMNTDESIWLRQETHWSGTRASDLSAWAAHAEPSSPGEPAAAADTAATEVNKASLSILQGVAEI